MNVDKPQRLPYASQFFLALAALSLIVFGLILAAGAGSAQAQTANGKYDTDGDGLIEVSNLEQLDAIRYDLDGDGSPSDANAYAAAFPVGSGEAVCGSGCTGYELEPAWTLTPTATAGRTLAMPTGTVDAGMGSLIGTGHVLPLQLHT